MNEAITNRFVPLTQEEIKQDHVVGWAASVTLWAIMVSVVLRLYLGDNVGLKEGAGLVLLLLFAAALANGMGNWLPGVKSTELGRDEQLEIVELAERYEDVREYLHTIDPNRPIVFDDLQKARLIARAYESDATENAIVKLRFFVMR